MKKSVIFVALGVMAILLAAAVIWDSLRYANNAHERVMVADGEMRKQERRLIDLVAGSAGVTPEVKAAIAAYQEGESPSLRREAYDKLVTSFRQTMSATVDPTDPLGRKFADEIAGAINRREVAQKQYDAEWAAYHDALSSFRGRVARLFFGQARADWEASKYNMDASIKVEKEL
jgi:hypothetical protein